MIFVRIWGANGLALAFSAAGIASMIMLAVFLKRKVGQLRGREILTSAIKTTIASAVMFVALFLLCRMLETMMPLERKVFQLLEVGILFVVGVAVFFVAAIVLKMKEVESVKSIFLRKFKKG
jgi:putative peptidoglycan lipid II flippase